MNAIKSMKIAALALSAASLLTTAIPVSANGRLMGQRIPAGGLFGSPTSGHIGPVSGAPIPGPRRGSWGGPGRGYWGGGPRFGGYWGRPHYRFGYGYSAPVVVAGGACPVGFFLNYWGHCLPIKHR